MHATCAQVHENRHLLAQFTWKLARLVGLAGLIWRPGGLAGLGNLLTVDGRHAHANRGAWGRFVFPRSIPTRLSSPLPPDRSNRSGRSSRCRLPWLACRGLPTHASAVLFCACLRGLQLRWLCGEYSVQECIVLRLLSVTDQTTPAPRPQTCSQQRAQPLQARGARAVPPALRPCPYRAYAGAARSVVRYRAVAQYARSAAAAAPHP